MSNIPLGPNFATEFSKGAALGRQLGLQREVKGILGRPTPDATSREELIGDALLKAGEFGTGVQIKQLGQRSRLAQQQAKSEQEQKVFGAFLQNANQFIKNKDQQGLDSLIQGFKGQFTDNPTLSSVMSGFDNVSISGSKAKVSSKGRKLDETSPLVKSGLAQVGDLVDTVSEYDPETGAFKLVSLSASSGLQPSKDIQKKVLDLQGKGAREATDADLQSLPSQAFIKLGSGDQEVTMVKPSKPLTTEAAAKFAVAKKARQGAQELLSDFNTDPSNFLKANIAGIGPAKKFSQQFAARLDLITEGLGRALSGAAVPESEIKNFRSLFAVNPTDTPETIQFKLQRSIDIVNDMESLIKYGDATDVNTYLSSKKQEVQEVEESQKPVPGTPPQDPVEQLNEQTRQLDISNDQLNNIPSSNRIFKGFRLKN
jgi:hypothetical protein|tara:strand:+ start:615 stop:1898 length:1284 start_codon:yes stop_codon:yes gene_type:complete